MSVGVLDVVVFMTTRSSLMFGKKLSWRRRSPAPSEHVSMAAVPLFYHAS